MEHYARLPQDLSQGKLIALADIENPVLVHHLRPACGANNQAVFVRAQFVRSAEKKGYTGIGEQERILASLFPVESGFRQHEVQQTANARDRIVNCNGDAGAQRVRNQNCIWAARYFAVSDSHSQAAPHQPSFRPLMDGGLR
jgi:hypothetical protein